MSLPLNHERAMCYLPRSVHMKLCYW